PVAEHAGWEALRGNDDARVRRRIAELHLADRSERQVAERAAAIPVLVALLGREPLRPRVGTQVGQRLQPLDPREAVPVLAAPLRIGEVLDERPRVGLAEAEPAPPPQ